MPYLHVWVFSCQRCHNPISLPVVFPEPGYHSIEKTWDRFDLHCQWCSLLQTVFACDAIRFDPQPWSPPQTANSPGLLFDPQHKLNRRP